MPTSGLDPVPARIVLDTSAYSHLRRGHEAVIDAVSRAEVVHLPATVLGELEAGFRLGRRQRENRRSLAQFLDEPFVNVVDVTAAVAARYGAIFEQLRRDGTPIPVNDIWIGASTLSVGAHLVTFDTDFARIVGLPTTIWPA
jgi:tRNA(fMet)-specific endonuclease VapC